MKNRKLNMIKLMGHSGCKIELTGNIVKKISKNKQYNDRLILQSEKQNNYKHPFVRTPKIYNSGYTPEGNFYIEMEYIRGVSFSKYCIKNNIKKCKKIVSLLTEQQVKTIDIRESLYLKIQSMQLNKEDADIILQNDWNVPTGYCHGDLTFENIIIQDDDVYLIDFLDSFVEAPIVDQAKILQDSFCYWSFNDVIPRRKLMHISNIFDTKRHYCMLLLHLHRIVPYANEEKKKVLSCMIQKTKNKINQF